ncbi:transcription initiation factor TFIID subunit 4-like [Octopus vulgaris]|uniref:Transcription initiation factor TFIID subunit 4-like n=1 Tax=Octopus vulgaris TaxID=6645 RepID=A0AA36BNB1_OCTVU|nr:transcription initiation factor TFIID subunit 4-like [Octopus vulgaris]
MAATNSIEELLSSEVDENEVSALVGSLESRLASPTHKESSQDVSDSVVVPITAPATTDRVGSNGNSGATSNSNVGGSGATKSTGNTTGIGATGTNHINNTATSCVGANLGIGPATAPTVVTVAASSQPASSTVSAPFASIQAVSQGQKGIPLVTAGGPQMNKNTAPISKAPMDTQIIGISSILSPTNATVTGTGAGGVVGTGSPACGATTVPGASGVSLLNVNTPNTVQIPTNSGKIGNTQTIRIITQTSSVANTNNSNPNVPYVHPIARPLGPTQPQPVQHQVVTTDSNGAATAVQKNTATSGVVTNQTNQTTNSAIYNLATIAAERKPLMVPHMTVQQTKSMQTANRMTVREQIDQRQDKTGGQKITTTTTTTPPVTSTPIMKPDQSTGHFVIKDTTRNITTASPKTEITCSRDTMARVTSSVVTSTQQNLQNVHIVKGLSQQVNPNVITVSRTQPQVSMVQPQILTNNATQMRIVTLNNQNIHTSRALTVNAGSLGKTTNNRVGAVRINTSQPSQQINIAPRPGGTNAITLPTSIQLQPGTVLVKNEQGQLVLVHASQSSVLQPQTSTNTTVLPGKLQNVKPMCNQGQPRQPTSTPTILTIQQPQGQATTSSHHTVLRQTVPVNHNPVQVSPVTQNSTGSTTTMPSTIPVGHNQASNVLPNQNSNMIDNVRKCKNFMATLLKLASNQRPETIFNVRELIQGLIDGKVDPESFTEKLQIELQSSPQPCLVPFLKKSLPLLRHSLYMNKMSIDGVRPPPPEVIRVQTMCSVPNTTVMTHTKQNVHSHTHNRMTHVTTANRMTTQPQVHGVMSSGHIHQPTQTIIKQVCPGGQIGHVQVRGGQAKMTTTTVGHPGITVTKSNLGTMTTVGRTNLLNTLPTSTTNLQSHLQIKKETLAPHKEKRKYESLKDDDDINDVATMGGVNLSEETRNIMATNADFIGTQIRSCKDECFLYHSPLLSRISSIAKKYGIEEVPSDVANIVSHATQERLRDFIEKLSTIAEHRTEIYKMDSRYEVKNDVRSILKHFEELERLEKKRHEEQEREMLLRVAKSRSKHEDPEQLKLKQKAKELQLAEMEEMRQREANITALAAIGPRKKRKTEAGDSNQTGSSTSLTNGGVSSSSVRPVVSRPRIKRVNLRDLLFLMEQDKSLCRSTLMYKSFFK